MTNDQDIDTAWQAITKHLISVVDADIERLTVKTNNRLNRLQLRANTLRSDSGLDREE